VSRILLDTHFVMFLAGDYPSIRSTEAEALETATLPWLVSAISIWEIRMKWHARNRFGERKGPISPDAVLQTLKADAPRFRLVALRAEQPALPLDPPLAHGDPFYEMLLIQAEAEGAVLLSRDRKLAGHRLVMSL